LFYCKQKQKIVFIKTNNNKNLFLLFILKLKTRKTCFYCFIATKNKKFFLLFYKIKTIKRVFIVFIATKNKKSCFYCVYYNQKQYFFKFSLQPKNNKWFSFF